MVAFDVVVVEVDVAVEEGVEAVAGEEAAEDKAPGPNRISERASHTLPLTTKLLPLPSPSTLYSSLNRRHRF